MNNYIDYYHIYLWKVNWTNILAFLFLVLFVIARLVWRVKGKYHQKSLLHKCAIVMKGLGWLGILAIYHFMLYTAEPDLFSSAQWIEGEVESKSIEQKTDPAYRIEIRSADGTRSLIVDKTVFETLQNGQNVKMSYLPHRQEVVTCEIMQ